MRIIQSNMILVLLMTLFPLMLSAGQGLHNEPQPAIEWQDEVIYHVMQRSFYDSTGDRHGDLQGFIQKLDYLEELGVTAILFTPLYKSDFYHNYFPIDYETIDPRYGTMEDYLAFIRAVHARDMKFIKDMETQYVQNGNLWFEDSYKNPDSPYSDFIFYHDEDHVYPQQFLREKKAEFYTYRAWPDQELHIFHLDMNHPAVLSYMKDYYAFWMDPHGDGSQRDGVDGFRIDHIMDDLDYKGIFTNLYADFWRPVFDHLKEINPDVFIVGEQSNWASYGEEMIAESGADASFGFLIRYAIADLLAEEVPEYAEDHDAEIIGRRINETIELIPEGRGFVHFLENHDIDRWASVVGQNEAKTRCGAALTMLLPGIPAIYYGQELGVTGLVQDWSYDVNHLPVREAFPWTPDPDEEGMATFFKDTGPWWDMSYFVTGKVESFALSMQRDDPGSLYNLYRSLIKLRKDHIALRRGDFRMLGSGEDNLFAFERSAEGQTLATFINLSEEPMRIDASSYNEILFSDNAVGEDGAIELEPFGFVVVSE